MARTGYPRPGHRLAPATLREILQVPLPAEYLGDRGRGEEFLCDLDETAWERFGTGRCRALAQHVLRVVGRAARTAMPIADRRLPPIPEGMTLADLDLEVRTINCLVSAGIHKRPQDLQRMTLEGVLGLRGFWVKSLVDLLTSLEYLIEHPEARKAGRSDAIVMVKHLRAAHRYPRPGHRLAPQTLKELLLDRLPSQLVRGTAFRRARLCDLDERVWEDLDEAVIGQLAGLVVARAAATIHNRTIVQRHLPQPPPGMRLEELRLENRTHHCLQRAGFAERPEDLGKLTVGELLSIRAFGSKCMVDLLTSLETRVAREGTVDDQLTAEAAALGEMPQAARIQFTDPRLGAALRAIDSESSTIGELVGRLAERRLDPPDPVGVRRQIRQLRMGIRQLSDLPLEEELVQIFAPSSSRRDRQIVAEYYGWDGQGGRTLEELGRKHHLSRERIRQICVRAVRRNRDTAVFAPVLDRALEFLAQRLPMGLERLQKEFDAAGFSARRLPLQSLGQAAEFLRRRIRFAIIDVGRARLTVSPKDVEIPPLIVQAARQAVTNYGIAKIGDVAAGLAERLPKRAGANLIRETLQTRDDFHWLDEAKSWFRLDALPQYGLPNMIEKVLSVTKRIEVSKLMAAIGRCRRSGRRLPPPHILLEFCRQMSGVRVERNLLVSEVPRDWRAVLGGVERGMVEVLREHGPVMERTAFEELCLKKGMNRFSFNAIVMSSPVIAQYGRSVYGLLGQKVSRKTLEALANRRPGTAHRKVLRAHGQTVDGRPYLAYRLSRAAISGGVITVPAAMKRQVRGRFTLRTDEGHRVGTLVARKGCGWGLGPALRGGRAEQGDHMLLLFDTAKRQARIRLGDESIIEGVADK